MSNWPQPVVEVRYPFPDSALPSLWYWCDSFRKNVADDYAPQTLEEFVDLELQRTADGILKFGVYRDDELGGAIWAQPVNDYVVNCHCVFKKEFFGRATSDPALVQMSEILFERGFRKIQMPIFEHNKAVNALLKRLGARREGVLRNQTTQNGKFVNIALFAFHAPDGAENVAALN